ncbi:MAG: hypothetical protein WC554_07490 [Clostridia bacterium]
METLTNVVQTAPVQVSVPVEQSFKIEDVLNMVKKVNDTFAYEVFVPSLNKTVFFREINTSQQKRLIKAIIDSPVFNTEFIFALRQIVKENCVDEKIITDNLTILDKFVIALSMRSVSIGDNYEVELECPNEKCKTPYKQTLSLKAITDKAKTVQLVTKTITDESGKFSCDCSIPTVSVEYQLEKEFRSNVDDTDIKNVEEARKMIGDVFIGEIVKYINTLTVVTPEKTIQFGFNNVSMQNRITLIEQLPDKFVKKIIEYINDISKEIDKVSLLNFECTKCKEKIDWRMTLNANFFTNS